jgi:hypothetical protein
MVRFTHHIKDIFGKDAGTSTRFTSVRGRGIRDFINPKQPAFQVSLTGASPKELQGLKWGNQAYTNMLEWVHQQGGTSMYSDTIVSDKAQRVWEDASGKWKVQGVKAFSDPEATKSKVEYKGHKVTMTPDTIIMLGPDSAKELNESWQPHLPKLMKDRPANFPFKSGQRGRIRDFVPPALLEQDTGDTLYLNHKDDPQKYNYDQLYKIHQRNHSISAGHPERFSFANLVGLWLCHY